MNKDELLASLSLEERAKLFVGKNTWELEPINNKSIFLSDGPHGIRKEYLKNGNRRTVRAVCYPSASLSACSFNEELLYRMGEMLGREAIRNNVDVLLGPGTNIKRNPLCGRNFEYFSEDPFLSGHLAKAYIKGVQSKNVGCCLKHFACNQQEKARFINDSIVDERALREIYLKPFEIAIRESKPWAIMASYNKINGVHATENKYLMNQIARKEFGFDGAFISDWGALDDSVMSIAAGLNLEMPGNSKGSSERIVDAILEDKLPEEILNESTKRLIDLYFKAEKPKVDDFNLDEALSLAREINEESIVLLRNENNILPLKRSDSIALIGDFCVNPRYQGGGSSQINSSYISNLHDEFRENNINFTYAKGYTEWDIEPNYELIEKAKEAAANKDKVILMVGLPRIIESEGYDREDMRLPKAHLELINEIYKVNKNIVVILQNGAPVELPFIDKTPGIIEAYLGGSMHAEALRRILYGIVNPSGRLSESFPIKYEDVASASYYLKDPFYSLYKESIYVGYRHYESCNIPVRYPFGYGLSYSNIEYKDYSIKRDANKLICSFKLANNSDIDAKETVMIFVSLHKSNIYRPKKELKGFTKLLVKAHSEVMGSIIINIDDLKYYDLSYHNWKLEAGNYRFYLAKNVSDEANYIDLGIVSSDVVPSNTLIEYKSLKRALTDLEFEKLCNRRLDLNHSLRPFTKDSPISDLYKTFLGTIVFKPLAKIVVGKVKNKYDKRMLELSIPYQPIRSIQMLSNISKDQIDGIVDIFNNHPIKGLKKLRKGK